MIDLFKELTDLLGRLDAERVEYALCGGLGMAVYGFARATLDIDILIEPESLEHAKAIAQGLGYTFDSGLMKFKGGAIQIHRLVKIPEGSSDALPLDLMLVTPEIHEVWSGRRRLPWQAGTLSVVSPKGLIQLKSMRLSGQDQDDIVRLRSIADED